MVKLTEFIEKMKLEILTPEVDVTHIKLSQPDINRPALQMAGYFKHFDSARVQVIGFVEYTYMEEMTEDQKRLQYDKLMSYKIPCIVFSRNLLPTPSFWILQKNIIFPFLAPRCLQPG